MTGVAVGAALASVYLLTELATAQALKRLAYNVLPVIRPSSDKQIAVSNGMVTGVVSYALNRNIANLMLLFWPLVLLARERLSAGYFRLALTSLAALWALIALTSQHETSSIALLLSLAVFFCYRSWPTFGRWAVTCVLCASVILVIPAAAVAYQSGLYQADWLPTSGRARIILWDVTARKVLRTPFLGIGIRSTRVLDAQNPNRRTLPDGLVYPRRTGRHAHNVYLQTWYELGAVGAVFLLIVGLLVLRRLSRLSASLRPYAFSACTLICAIAAFSWGMWQSWFVSSIATGIIFLAMALRSAGDGLLQDTRATRHAGQIGDRKSVV